jgi:uncharacterized repeat protein (TIGR01451 family)/uncharacterized protein (TIGR03382 family)
VSPAGRTSAAALLVLLVTAAGAAELQIQNNNNPGEGFNDGTPANPTGLNFGTTRGDQALIVFQTASAIWGATLRSAVPIVVDSAFSSATDDPRFACTSSGEVIGYARLTSYETGPSFPNPQAGYVVALANAISGMDLTPGEAHILARFNGDLGTPACPQASWSFALDGTVSDAGSQLSLVTTLLHELGHGLGYVSFIPPDTGDPGNGPPSIFDYHLFDLDAGTSWVGDPVTMRKAVAKTPGALAFDGDAVRGDVPLWLGFAPELLVTPQGMATVAYQFVPGIFSGPLTGSGPLALANPLDACMNLAAGSLTGKVALIVRGGTDPSDPNGSCTFLAKSNRAAAAGAMGVIIFNNVASPPYVRMAGSPSITIPAVFISQADGQTLQTQVTAGPVEVDFAISTQRANTDPSQTRVLLYTPPTVDLGSSVSHWNNASYPQTLLMEPFIQPDMRLDMDFTPEVMADLGWSVVRGLTVSVVKALEPTVPVGGDARYIIAVLNRRSTAISGVSLDLSLPAGTTVVSAQGACSALPCSLGALDQGAVKLVVATVRLPASPPDPFAVTATVTPSSADAADNLTATTTSPVASGGDLQVTVAAPSQIAAGAGATFTVTLTNAGPGTATGVTVSRSATAGSTSLQVSGGGGACSSSGCSLATLAPGASQAFSSQVSVPAGFSGSVTVTATVTSATPDPNSANNTASATASTAPASSGKSGCSATGEPATALGMAAVALALLRRRQARAVS